MERTLESRGHLTERQGLGRADRPNVLVHFPRRKRPDAGRADDAGRTDDEGLARLHVPIGNPPGAVELRGCISQARPSGERRNGAPNFRCPTTRGRISRADGERSIRIVGGAHQSHTWPLPRVRANQARRSSDLPHQDANPTRTREPMPHDRPSPLGNRANRRWRGTVRGDATGNPERCRWRLEGPARVERHGIGGCRAGLLI